jgi:hypothetical protein
MSLNNFIVPEIEEYQGIPEGAYTAQVDHIEYINSNFGNYYIVNWRILRPSELEGKIHQEKFSIEHENDQVRHIAIQNFAKLCVEIGGLSKGDSPKEENFLFKVANILIRNKNTKDGKVYKNVVKRELVNSDTPKETAQTILNDIAPNNLPNDTLNDQVPF